ncbi:MAG: D-aminoacyl-tRNA deacylase [Planctomycetota bacterium]|jgi:D-tyrosyl-tRNA(Tyr) deacylase
MKAVLQRVRRAAVRVEEETVSEIGRGVLILLGVEKPDTEAGAEALAKKISGLRIFEDDAGKMNLSCEQIGGEFLVVSQFTLAADLAKGKRPGFDPAMRPPGSERLYERFCAVLAGETGRPVKRGRFGASMLVEIENEGPVTFVLGT